MRWTRAEKKLAILNVALGFVLVCVALKAFAWVDETQYRQGIVSEKWRRFHPEDKQPRRRHGRVHRKQG